MKPNLRKLIDREEFDYHALLSALEGYASPRAKITQLLQKGAIIRVKKGLYVFGEDFHTECNAFEIYSVPIQTILRNIMTSLIFGILPLTQTGLHGYMTTPAMIPMMMDTLANIEYVIMIQYIYMTPFKLIPN